MWGIADFKIIAVSFRYTKDISQWIEASVTSLALWKVAGAIFAPNAIFVDPNGWFLT